MNPDYLENNGNPGSSLTKVATGLCILSAVVSFLGYLPRFQPYTIFKLENLLNKFPKIWILLTSPFYYDSLFSFVLNCVVIVFLSRMIEPIWGSKEYLRFVIMSAIYPTLFIFIFVTLFYFITDQELVLTRVFNTSSTVSSALFIALSKVFFDVSIPTRCGNLKPRYLPIFSFSISVLLSFLDKCDSLLSTIAGYAWAILYIQKLQPHNGKRGNPEFKVENLLPSKCCSLFEDEDGENLGNNPQNMMPGDVPPPTQPPRRQPRNDNQFVGTPHRIG